MIPFPDYIKLDILVIEFMYSESNYKEKYNFNGVQNELEGKVRNTDFMGTALRHQLWGHIQTYRMCRSLQLLIWIRSAFKQIYLLSNLLHLYSQGVNSFFLVHFRGVVLFYMLVGELPFQSPYYDHKRRERLLRFALRGLSPNHTAAVASFTPGSIAFAPSFWV